MSPAVSVNNGLLILRRGYMALAFCEYFANMRESFGCKMAKFATSAENVVEISLGDTVAV